MDANTRQVSVIEIKLEMSASITPHQIYAACKPFGVIVECGQRFDHSSLKLCIKFTRSIHTDRLKPSNILRIGNEKVNLIWLHEQCPLQQSPELHSYQQSPRNILDALNNDCLREIFVNLPELDRCAVAHVCHRFRDVVLGIKPKHMKITTKSTTPLWKFEGFLRIFGKSIQTAHITKCQCPDIVLVFLSKHCENLVEVDCAAELRSATINEVAALFPRLRRVRLHHEGAADIVFQPNDEIESIRVGRVAHLPPIHFPKLRDLQLHIASTLPSIEQFLVLNSQIEKLVIQHAHNDDSPMSIILEKLPRLQELLINWFDLTTDDIRALCQATHLHTLEFTMISGGVTPMLQAFVKNGIQLKRLKLFTDQIAVSYDIDLLIKMKSLEHLIIDCLSDDQLVRVVENLPSLKTIEIESDDITPRGIRDALRCANGLENVKFTIYVDSELIVDQSNIIDEIGEFRAKKPINIKAILYIAVKTGGNEEAIKNMLNRHSKWLKYSSY